MPSTSGVSLAVAGLSSGFDWQSLITQLAQAERTPETQWATEQNKINTQNSDFSNIKTYLTELQTSINALKDSTIYQNRSATSASTTVATATSANAGTTGSFSFNISQLATAASYTGTGNASGHISATNDVSGVTVGTANFATPVTAGNFTVNGAQVTIATTDSLQSVFDKIATATGNAVTASYDSISDKITLSSASAIALGSAADTSNFLQVAKLYNNTGATSGNNITSNDTLGRVIATDTLANANLGTTVSDGGSGAGQFTINGVAINFNASTDTLQDVLSRINSSAAGVTAAYDVVNNRFTLTNNKAGDVGVSMQDNTGNFLAATGLSAGTLNRGTNLTYTVNGGPTLVSQGNTIDSSSSGITGLSVTALTTGLTTVTVGSDTSAIQSNIQSLVTAYNNVQSYITANAASSTSSTGAVSTNALSGDMTAANIATNLRSATFSPVSVTGLPTSLTTLAGLGITTNGNDNTVTLDTSTLQSALSSNLNNIKNFFSDPTHGLAAGLDSFLNDTIGDNGTLTNHQTALTSQSNAITTQIQNLEKQITNDTHYWTTEFQNMETASAKSNQVLSSLQQQISKGTL